MAFFRVSFCFDIFSRIQHSFSSACNACRWTERSERSGPFVATTIIINNSISSQVWLAIFQWKHYDNFADENGRQRQSIMLQQMLLSAGGCIVHPLSEWMCNLSQCENTLQYHFEYPEYNAQFSMSIRFSSLHAHAAYSHSTPIPWHVIDTFGQ